MRRWLRPTLAALGSLLVFAGGCEVFSGLANYNVEEDAIADGAPEAAVDPDAASARDGAGATPDREDASIPDDDASNDDSALDADPFAFDAAPDAAADTGSGDGSSPDAHVDASLPDAASDATGADASMDAGSDAPADTGSDAANDVGPDTSPVCTVVDSNDMFQPVDPRWVNNGSAVFIQNGVELTPDVTSRVGTLWWNQNILFDAFSVSFAFSVSSRPRGSIPADGVGFGWIPGNNVNAIGGTGSALGFNGLLGFGVAVVTYNQQINDPPPPFVAVVDTNVNHLISSALPFGISGGFSHTLLVKFRSSQVTVWVDGALAIDHYTIPGYQPYSGSWGFFGATGGFSSFQAITNVSASFGPGCGI